MSEPICARKGCDEKENRIGGFCSCHCQDIADAYADAIEDAADIVKTWHISKGGFGELEHRIRGLQKGRRK